MSIYFSQGSLPENVQIPQLFCGLLKAMIESAESNEPGDSIKFV